MEKNVKSIAITAVFIIFLFGLSLGSILTKDRDFSEVENRQLNTVPKFSAELFADGAYQDKLEKYTQDQLFLKDSLVIFKNHALKAMGRTKINDVYLAGQGKYLQEYIEDKDCLLENLKYIKNWCAVNGLSKENCYLLIAPSATGIYPENLPLFNLVTSEQKSINRVEEELSDIITVINPFDVLLEHKDEYIYYRTDHHWTMDGAFYAYKELAAALRINGISLEDMKKTEAEDKFLGSLYSQAPLYFAKADDIVFYDYTDISYTVSIINPVTNIVLSESDSYINREQLKKKDKYAALFGGNFGLIRIVNHTPSENAKNKKLLVFKDSYANSLIPYLIKAYEEIDIIDLRFFDYINIDLSTYGADNGYTEVLFLYNISFINSDTNFMGLSSFYAD